MYFCRRRSINSSSWLTVTAWSNSSPENYLATNESFSPTRSASGWYIPLRGKECWQMSSSILLPLPTPNELPGKTLFALSSQLGSAIVQESRQRRGSLFQSSAIVCPERGSTCPIPSLFKVTVIFLFNLVLTSCTIRSKTFYRFRTSI